MGLYEHSDIAEVTNHDCLAWMSKPEIRCTAKNHGNNAANDCGLLNDSHFLVHPFRYNDFPYIQSETTTLDSEAQSVSVARLLSPWTVASRRHLHAGPWIHAGTESLLT